MTVDAIPPKLLVMVFTDRICAFEVDANMRSSRAGNKVIEMLGNIVAPLLEEAFEGEVNRRFARTVFAV